MIKSILLTAAMVFVAIPAAQAADAAAGKAKSSGCAGCHGPAGISSNPMYPNLAGQQAMYLEKSIKDYKTGARKDAMMQGMVSALSDADIANLAAYYNTLK